jgi:hypothetical protein
VPTVTATATAVVPSTPLAPVVTQAEAIAVAQAVYRPTPVGGTCDDQAPSGPTHYASCPFTPALATRFANEAPTGSFNSGCQASCHGPLLCRCQYGPIRYSSYVATVSASGWTVRLTNDAQAQQWFILDVSDVDGVPTVTDIRYQVDVGCIREIDGPPC